MRGRRHASTEYWPAGRIEILYAREGGFAPREGVRYDVAVITVVAAAAGCRNEALH